MSLGGAYAIGWLIEKFQNFLESILEPKPKSDIDKLLEIDIYIKKTFDVSVKEIFDSEFLVSRLSKIESRILNDLILLVFKCSENKKDDNFLSKINKQDLDKRLLEIIDFIEKNSNDFSVERNDLKNTLQHR